MGWWSSPKVSAADVYDALSIIGRRVDEVHSLVRANAARLALTEKIMAWSTQDVERANAVTTRLAAAFRSLHDENVTLRSQLSGLTSTIEADRALSDAQAEAHISQLESLFANGADPVPAPPAEGVSDQPGGEVPAVAAPEQAVGTGGGTTNPGGSGAAIGDALPPGGATVVDDTPAEGSLGGELGDGQVVMPGDAAAPAPAPAAEGAGSPPAGAPTELSDGQTNV